jgi:hypothetical protein
MEAGVGFGIEIEQGVPHKKTRGTWINVPRVTVVTNACCECSLGFFQKACNPDQDHGAYKCHDDGANQPAARP